MEKLIKLLNEFENEEADTYIRYWNYYQNGFHLLEYGQTYSEMLIISKKYKFIKRLIDKNKIDRNLLDGAILHKTHRLLEDDYGVENMNKQYYEKTLMLLAISENPLELLDSLLK